MSGWLRGLVWLQPVLRTVAVGGYLVLVAWASRRAAGVLSRGGRVDGPAAARASRMWVAGRDAGSR